MKRLLLIIYMFIFTIVNCNSVIIANAIEENNINMVILFSKDKIDNDVKQIVTKSGGKIVKEMSEIGALEVECNSKLIPEIKNKKSVESLSPNHIIKLETNKIANSNNYYEDKGNSYYENKGSSYYEDKGNSYYEDKGNSYYEDKGNSYYEGKSSSDLEDDSDEELDDIFEGNLYEKYQWDIKRVTNNGESFNIESGNHNVIVGVIDSGVDTDHLDLKGNFMGGKNFVPEAFQDNSSEKGDVDDIEDRFGHGTEVTGQIAANGRIKGVAPGVGFKSYRVFDENGQTTTSICADAIIEAVNDKVNVINLSLGAYYIDGECLWKDEDTGEYISLGNDMADFSLLQRAIEYAVKNNVIVVTAAGNEGLDCSDNVKLTEYFNELYEDDGFFYKGLIYEEPGQFEGVINVSATTKSDDIALYSNYGEGFIDITAPGGDYGRDYSINNMCISTYLDNGYSFDIGTSLSAPKVSGAIAIMLCKNKDLTYSEVVQKLNESSEKLGDSKYYGTGMVNVYNELKQ